MRTEVLAAAVVCAWGTAARRRGGDVSDRDVAPAHPAFLAVRRLRVEGGGSLREWLASAEAPITPVQWSPLAAVRSGETGWEIASAEGKLLMRGAEVTHVAPVASVGDAIEQLASRLDQMLTGLAATASDVELEPLRRARAILDARDSGEELSDVAWPHFLLPPAAPLPARRLAAAAASAWVFDGMGAWTGRLLGAAEERLRAPVESALGAAVQAI